MRTAVFSILSPNYRHYARVLMASLQRHHPEWDRFALIAGDEPSARDEEAFRAVAIDALPLPHPRQFKFRYTLLELNTAVKPWMFEHLFARGYDRVIYFDPDIVVYSALAELREESFLTLTPHLTAPIGDGESHPSERTILQAGTYNLGFLAVMRQPRLDEFLAWWKERLERQCVVDVARGLFVDQKWMDLAPGFFDGVEVLRHDGYNVAYWNLAQRAIDGDRVNGQPLRFFHFSGFSPAFPRVVSRHAPAISMRGVGDAARLFDDYARALQTSGFDASHKSPYPYGTFDDGSRVSDAARFAYRTSALLQEKCGDDPFAHPELFAGLRDTVRPPISAIAALRTYRALAGVRPLVKLVPRNLRTFMRETLLGRRDVPLAPPPRVASELAPGLNIVGYVNRDTGVGESARLCASSCDAAGVPNRVIDVDDAATIAPEIVHRATIHHVNADQVAPLRERIPRLFEASEYNIGCWHWELPEFPDIWKDAAASFDEIWAPSAFIQSAVAAKVTIPVVHMPHGVEVNEIEACSPRELGVPEGRFVFLTMFDFGSVEERKNPFGAIEAFRRAGLDATLLIKTTGGSPDDLAKLAAPNVVVAGRLLTRARVNGLIAACDAVVSLHRSEGFGLILAEAMALGKPVIATGWSGNMDFMDSGNSCPVAYDLVTLDRAYGPYAAGQQWAEPDVDHAASLMRRVFEDASFRTRIGERAKETMRSRFSAAAAGGRYRRRLELLHLLSSQA